MLNLCKNELFTFDMSTVKKLLEINPSVTCKNELYWIRTHDLTHMTLKSYPPHHKTQLWWRIFSFRMILSLWYRPLKIITTKVINKILGKKFAKKVCFSQNIPDNISQMGHSCGMKIFVIKIELNLNSWEQVNNIIHDI